MLITNRTTSKSDFEKGTGWTLRPEGACRGDVCVPLETDRSGADFDVAAVANELGMPIVRHSNELAALGPATLGGRVLTTAEAPELILPSFDGEMFDLRTLRGQKVVLVAWSPY
jgi:hypothetical protein